ncbi:hypothetical protein O6H91_17G037000 [Diphasiastrum complanatum]|uniref:Uncharacterized protein n=1 Tax=Diphasiastrum complanatum TaxID=34168 RepID=A0ACC2B5R2_DIPCM|nr:hypothetical protein O6H91_17G037000 [Diphasiastrum complanatum]
MAPASSLPVSAAAPDIWPPEDLASVSMDIPVQLSPAVDASYDNDNSEKEELAFPEQLDSAKEDDGGPMIAERLESVEPKMSVPSSFDPDAACSLNHQPYMSKLSTEASDSKSVSKSVLNRQSSMSKLSTEASDSESKVSNSVLNRQSSMSKLNAEAPVFIPKGLMSFPQSPGGVAPTRSTNPGILPATVMLQPLHLGAVQGVNPPLLQQLDTTSPISGSRSHTSVWMPRSSSSMFGAGSPPPYSPTGPFAVQLSGSISASRSLQPTDFTNAELSSTPEHGDDAELLSSEDTVAPALKSAASEDLKAKIAKQVEFYFSDNNLPTDNHLMKFVKKDPEGFVPIPVVASFRKMKSLTKNHAVVAAALRASSLLVVSEDGKKVRRAQPLPDVDLEEVQSRTVVAENLPEDHSIQQMEQLFGTVGNVKLVRICQPEAANGANQTAAKFCKTDLVVSNKLHALVEYESVEEAERAVAELTDERNWRSGLRVRLLIRRTFQGKYGHQYLIKGRKLGTDAVEGNEIEEDAATGDGSLDKSGDEPGQQTEASEEYLGDVVSYEKDGGRRGRGRNRGRGRGSGQYITNTGRGHLPGTPPQTSSPLTSDFIGKPPPGPRMPDGTRGFTFGRGKLLSSEIS